MRRVKGFTLIELLVVISIIALLMAIMIPALAVVKEKATGSVCLGNQRGLIQSYILYCNDNGDRLVNACSGWTNIAGREINPWVDGPTLENGNQVTGAGQEVTLEDRLRGIRNGALYQYAQNVDLYHCRGDKRIKQGTEQGGGLAYKMFRSYGIQGGLNGEEDFHAGYSVKKHSQIRQPSSTYVFVEENYDGAAANFNGGSWQIDGQNSGESWWNAPAVFHNEGSSLSYADGSARVFKWRDPQTISFAINRKNEPYEQPDNPDLDMMIDGYGIKLPFPGRRE